MSETPAQPRPSWVRLLQGIAQALRVLFQGPRYADELNDDAFYLRYYGNTTIPKEIPIRVRKVCVEQCGRRWLAVEPEDVPVDDELDLYELLQDIEEEFGIAIPKADMEELDTFDSIVRYLAGRIH